MKRKRWLLLPCLILLTASACAGTAEPEPQTRAVFAMDTYMTLTAYGENAQAGLDAAEAEIHRLDAALSAQLPSSQVSQINAAGGGALSADAAAIVRQAQEIWRRSEGALDITIYPLMEAWGFPSGSFQVPDEETLSALLEQVDAGEITLDGDWMTLGAGQQMDLGGVAKGYASQRAAEAMSACGVTAGILSLGGNVQALGTRPDGTLWRVGIQDPEGEDGALLATLSVGDCAVITSGGYQRYFEAEGITYHHILDPATGYPAHSGLTSVSIVSTDGALADGLSTACFVLGLEESIQLWRTYDGAFQAVFYTADGELFVTEGLSDAIDADRAYTVIPWSEESDETTIY